MKIAIIGAGASGLMCACKLAEQHTVMVFDKNSTSGKKLLLTGKGRCNITNMVEPSEFLNSIPHNSKFLVTALNSFTPADTITYFESIGVKTSVEGSNRVLPSIGRAIAVKEALENTAKTQGVKFKFNSQVLKVERVDEGFILETICLATQSKPQHLVDAVIIATGGVSYPLTGSTGDGYEFAKEFGHNIIPPRPALCGLQLDRLMGAPGSSVVCGIEIVDSDFNPTTNKQIGEMLFTKTGVSGPTIFKAVSDFKGQSIKGHFLQINFTPNYTREKLQEKLSKILKENAKKTCFYVFREFVSVNLANWLVDNSKIHKAKPCEKFTDKEREKIFLMLNCSQVPIKDFENIDTATITRGGVDIKDIDPKNMQSKLIKSLFFIGEVLDIDGLSGGFNLQIAFSTAAACAEYLKNI